MAKELTSFIERLHSDAAFRKRFVSEPARTLSEEGFDTDALALPDRIDEGALVAKLDKAVAGGEAAAGTPPEQAAETDLSKLSPNELWDRFGLIGAKTEESGVSTVIPVAVAVVIYGSSVAVGPVTVTGAVTVVGSVATMDQLKGLRQLTEAPLDQLKFSVEGPGGEARDLSAEVLRAFLDHIAARKS